MKIDASMITFISEQLADYADDLETFWDTLDGETDVMDVVGDIIKRIIETNAAIEMLDAVAKQYASRKDAMQMRKVAMNKALKGILDATGQKKIPHPFATISLRDGTESVEITNADAIPTQLCRITKSPDKAAIKKLLQAGEVIDGAELVTGPQTISMRIK